MQSKVKNNETEIFEFSLTTNNLITPQAEQLLRSVDFLPSMYEISTGKRNEANLKALLQIDLSSTELIITPMCLA